MEKRDIFGITARDMIDLKDILKCALITGKSIALHRRFKGKGRRVIQRLKLVLGCLQHLVLDLLRIEIPKKKLRHKTPPKTVFDFEREGFSAKFRSYTPEDVQRFIQGFQFPDVVRIKGYVFTSQEVVLISLSRLAFPLRWSDIQERFPGKGRKALQIAFYYFLDFCIVNLGYLILNNREYWVSKMVDQAEAIRRKLSELPYENWRLFFPPQINLAALIFLLSSTIL